MRPLGVPRMRRRPGHTECIKQGDIRRSKDPAASLGNYERWWQLFISSVNDPTHTHINTDTLVPNAGGHTTVSIQG